MDFAITAADRRLEVIADLSRDNLSAATQAAIMRELTHKAAGFRPGDLIAIADAVTGQRCADGPTAVKLIDKWSRARVQN